MKEIERKLYIVDKSYLKEDWQNNIKDMPIWRQQNIEKFIVKEPKELSYLASFLFKRAINDISANIKVNNINISFNQYGKPYIDDEKYNYIKFNISHSKNKAILAVAEEDIGCDIEKIHEIDINIAKKFFNKNEYEILSNIKDEKKQMKIFYKMWTLKESFLKRSGKGISVGLNEIDFSDINYDNMKDVTHFFHNGEMYNFYNMEEEDYLISICTKTVKTIKIINII